MSSLFLEKSLVAFLKEKVSPTIKLANKHGQKVHPAVYSGFLPPKGDDLEVEFPFLLVRLNSFNTDGNSNCTVQVGIFICTYDASRDFQGYQDGVLLAERIRRMLLQKRVLDNKFEIDPNVLGALPDQQAWPQWQTELNVSFTYAAPISYEGVEGLL